MYNISSRFKEALRGSHTIATKMEVYSASGELLKDNFKALSGNVSIDYESSTRRRATVSLVDADNDLIPGLDTLGSILHPLANTYVKLYRGIYFGKINVPGNRRPQDDIEYVPLGTFDIFDLDMSDTKEGLTLTIKLFDFARKIERARLLAPYTVNVGTNYRTAIIDIIEDGVSDITFDFPAIDFVTPALHFGSSGDQGGGDRWKYAKEMAASIGHDLYFSREGVLTLRPTINIDSTATSWRYDENQNANMLFIERKVTKEETYNLVQARGESTSNEEPVVATAQDNNPNSPTWVDGPYGTVPFFLTSNYIRTTEQAQQAANLKLNQLLGSTENIRLITIVNPAFEAQDLLEIRRNRLNVRSTYLLDKVNVPLEYSNSSNISLREVRRVPVE